MESTYIVKIRNSKALKLLEDLHDLELIELINEKLIVEENSYSYNSIVERLDELSEIPDNWYEGTGKAIAKEKIALFKKLFDSYFHKEFPNPYLFPTLNGDIQAEWKTEAFDISAEFLFNQKKIIFDSLNLITDESEHLEFDLEQKAFWDYLMIYFEKSIILA